MALKHLIREKLVSARPETTVLEVAKIMDDENVGAVVIVSEGKPIGVVTDRDLTVRCLAKSLNPELTTVEEIMTPSVETVRDSEGLYNAIHAMKNGMVRRIVVVNDAGIAVSVLSFDDLFAFVTEELSELKTLIQPLDNRLVENAAA